MRIVKSDNGYDVATRISLTARRSAAIKLKLAGASWDDIAAQLGYDSPDAAHDDLQRALRRRLDRLDLHLDELRQMELDRLDRLTMALWPKAMEGDVKAVDAINRLRIQYAKLLGLEAPIRHEVITVDAVTAEIRRLESKLGPAAARTPATIEGSATPREQ